MRRAETNELALDITILYEVISFSGPSRNCLLPLTRSDECVHVVGQYMKPIASTPKSGGGGGGGGGGKEVGGREGKGIYAVIVSPVNRNQKRSQCNQIFHTYDLLLRPG